MSSSGHAVLGLDVGGTHSRAVVADLEGHVLGRAAGPGANRWSSADGGRGAVAATAAAAVAEAGRRGVTTIVVAIAGWGAHEPLAEELRQRLTSDGTRPVVRVVPDVVANHAAGSADPAGTVLAAGTGVIAARIADGEVLQRSDGCGWLLGDEGSAVWIGTAAVRAVLRAIDGRGPATALREHVLAAWVPDLPADATADEQRVAIVEQGFAVPATRFGLLAPGALAVAEQGDPVAAAIASSAVEHLTRAVGAVLDATAPGDLVLAGSLLLGSDLVRDAVLSSARAAWPSRRVRTGRDGAAGAATLAVRAMTGVPLALDAHRRLCGATVLAD